MITGTSSRRRKSSASWPAISPAPTTPTLVIGRASQDSGAPAGFLARRWTRSKAYRLERSSSLMIRSASPWSSPAYAVTRSAVFAAAISSRARYGAGAAPEVFWSANFLPRSTAASQASPRSISGRSTVISPATTRPAQSSESARKSAPSNSASAMPSFATCGPTSILFWLRAFSMITVTALSGPIRLGSR